VIIRDGDWTLHSSDIKRGKHVWVRHNPDGSMTFRTDYVVDSVLDTNAAQRNVASSGWKGDWHHVASIPKNVVWDKLMDASIQGDEVYISRWLNDSDNAKFRTKVGRL